MASSDQSSETDQEATEVLSPEAMFDVASQRPHDVLDEGLVLGEYTIERLLGQGGGGVVYTARQRRTAKRVAIKVLRSEMVRFPTMVARFKREAAAVSKIRHPNIVDILEFGELGPGRPYYVMELLDGLDLRKLLEKHGRFSPSEALSLLAPVCHAVQAAHDAGFIHRDIKATNVVVEEKNGQRTIKLLDFGIAKLLHGEPAGQGLTEPGSMLGTPHSMAPEQIRAELIDQRADIYSLGVLIFQLITGQFPFQAADPRQVALMHLQVPPPRPSAFAPVSSAVDTVVLRCLEKNRDRRFDSASELLTALSAAVGASEGAKADGSAPALGVYFELTANPEQELDDDMMEDISNVLDTIEQDLKSRGFAFPLRTSNALLGVRMIANDLAPHQERVDEEAAIGQLRSSVEDRQNKHPGVQIAASLTLGEAVCRGTGPNVEVVGGPLLEIETWTVAGRLQAG